MLSKITPLRAMTAVGLVGMFVLGSCGSSSTTGSVATAPAPTSVSIMAMQGKAGTLISELYAQALESQGIRVARRAPATDLPAAITRLESGEADITFTYTDTLYTLLQADVATPATLVAGANLTDQINAIGEVLSEKISALPPASAQRGGLIACTKAVADDKKLTKLSELGRVADGLTLAATKEFNGDGPFSAANFTQVYGGEFKEIVTLSAAEIVTKLTAAEVDCAAFAALDGTVPEGVVALIDDRAFVPRDAVLPLVAKSMTQLGVTDILNRVSQALTTDGLITMMGAVETGGRSPEVVAGSFLTATGLSQKAGD